MNKQSLTWPTTAQTIQTSAETVTSQISATMESALAKLTAIKSEAGYSRHNLSSDAETILDLRDELNALLTQGHVLTASPYQYQVGTEKESGYYLNSQTAINTLIVKLRDQVDKNRPTGTLYCIAILVSGSQLTTFAEKLTNITAVLPLPDWCQVARQATALSTNSMDKLYQPAAISQPRFKPQASLNAEPLRGYLKQQGSQLATLESLAHDSTNVIEKLKTLAEKRASTLTAVSTAIDALKTLNVSLYSASLSGTTESIATELSVLSMPNINQYAVASLLLSSEPLTFFEKLLCGE